jgi:membrane dipeptidase
MKSLHQIGASIASIRMLYDLGVRYITLTHTCDNPFATSCTTVASGSPDYGLSEIGRHCIREMNRIGMLIDLSHVSTRTNHDTLSHSIAPVIFSHSGAYSIHHHPRNVPDSVLTRLRSTDGVVMVNFWKELVKGDECNVEDVARHVLHIVHVAGWR